MKYQRVTRMFQMLTALQSGQSFTVEELAEMLGISRRTVFRDLKDLERAGIPCRFDRKNNSYKIDSKVLMPSLELNSQEALSLLLVGLKAGNNIHLPFRDAILQAVLKVENSLPEKIKRYCNSVLKFISVRPGPQANINLLDKIFLQIQEAILNKRIIRMTYYVNPEIGCIETELHPYHLVHGTNSWHIIGRADFYSGVKTFKLTNIKKLRILNKCFVEDNNSFDLFEYLGRAWSINPEGTLHIVRLKFSAEIAQEIAQTQWHSTQQVEFKNDGSAIMEFRVDGLSEITGWILSYGDKVEVLNPPALRKKVTEIIRKMSENMGQ